MASSNLTVKSQLFFTMDDHQNHQINSNKNADIGLKYRRISVK